MEFDAHALVPSGAHTYSRGDESFPSSAPKILVRGRGPYTWDQDGQKFIDWAMAVRSVFAGHANPHIDRSAFSGARRGVNLSRPVPEEFELARKIIEAVPAAEMVKFGKNGSDATAGAIRLARAATGRRLILRSSEAPFLGVHDWFIGSTEMNAGVPAEVRSLTRDFIYGDLEDLSKKLTELNGQVAAVILEPLGRSEPSTDYLTEVKKLTQEAGALLIFDEVVSGFRLTFGGYQNLAGVKPDLTAFGKAMGNGYPISVLAGAREVMELGGTTHSKERVFLMSSTYGPERSGLRASLATLEALSRRGTYAKLNRRVTYLVSNVHQIFRSRGLSRYVAITGHSSSPNVTMLDESGQESLVRKTLLMDEMAKRRVLLGSHLFSPSIAHRKNVIEVTLRRLDESLEAVEHLFKASDDVIEEQLGHVVKPVFRQVQLSVMTGIMQRNIPGELRPKVIAELGINHQGDVDNATHLIRAAASAGCWGVKFQYRRIADGDGESPSIEIGDELTAPNIRRNYLSPKDILRLADLARLLGLAVGISFFRLSDALDFSNIEFDFYKVPSAVLTNDELLQALLETGKEVLVSTGMHSEQDYRKLSNKFGSRDNLVVLHCVSNYPTLSSNSQLGFMSQLKEKFGFRVGYSSHDAHWETCLWSLFFAPEYLERHITLDKSQAGLDHTSSSTPDEFERLVGLTNDFHRAIEGAEGPRKVNQGEKINLQNLGQGLYALRPMMEGEAVSAHDFEERPPLVGLRLSDLLGNERRILRIAIEPSEPLLEVHFTGTHENFLEDDIDWARTNRIGVPVRLHDIHEVNTQLKLDCYEFHLSFGEVRKDFDWYKIPQGKHYSVHAPDYVSPTALLDPFSSDNGIRAMSLEILRGVSSSAHRIAEISGNPVPVVSSLSSSSLGREGFYSEVKKLFSELSSSTVTFSLQWLPPIAWYFGGSVPLQKVNSVEDLDELVSNEVPVTMDFSHLTLGQNAGLYQAEQILATLGKNIIHLHLSGADGVDGEGVEFDESDISQRDMVQSALNVANEKSIYITLEAWQGHLNRYAGFRKGIRSMRVLSGG